jgi:uncharacterized membrane protein
MILPRSQLVDRWDRVRSSYWFVPSIMFLGAVLLAMGMLWLDTALGFDGQSSSSGLGLAQFEGEGARSILTTVATGMLTIVGVVFSLTILSLQLASSQFGPRLLRAFMMSVGNQIALGTFTSSFIYCIIVIGSIRNGSGFVPQLSTATGILISVFDIGVLIYFIHHVAASIRVESVIETISIDLRRVIDRLFPTNIGDEPEENSDPEVQRVLPGPARRVHATAGGYIRHIDDAMLMSVAVEHDLVLSLDRRPGDFVVEGTALAEIWPFAHASDEIAEYVRHSVVLGRDRTPLQDARFAIRQFVDLALRALSPGINDPFTAVECINRLSDGLCRAARRRTPSPYRIDGDGRLRVIARPMSVVEMAHAAFDPIARAGGENGDIVIRLLETILIVASSARLMADRAYLIEYAHDLKRQSDTQLPLERDRTAVAERFEAALANCERVAVERLSEGVDAS